MEGKNWERYAYHKRESEEEEAVHACSVTAHDLYKGMENLYMASRNFRVWNIVSFASIYVVCYSPFSVCPYHCVYAVLK